MKIHKNRFYNFYFMETPSGCVLTNDSCSCILTSKKEFHGFISGNSPSPATRKMLQENFFDRESLDFDGLAAVYRQNYLMDWKGPHVHIISVTNRCNSNCVYCSADSVQSLKKSANMNFRTARKVVNFIFQSGAQDLLIEFQGGEPLLNFKTVRFIINYARHKGREEKKSANFSIVTNLCAMNEEKLDFLVKNKTSFCTSLDGPKDLHDLNRKFSGGSGYELVSKRLKKLNDLAGRGVIEKPHAICTVTRFSLLRHKDIIDEYVKQGLFRIQLAPLDPIGRAKLVWDKVGYTADRFLDFYAKALNYILDINRKSGIPVYEKGALMFVSQIMTGKRPRYQNLDLFYRCAYDRDGGIYGSDEARLLADSGDMFLKLGDAGTEDFKTVLTKPIARAMLLSAFPGLTRPACARCACAPFCRLNPAYNYAFQKSFWGSMPSNERCMIYKGIFRMIFEMMRKPKIQKIFRKWLDNSSNLRSD